ncbi:MAG: Sbal_3080 family lipoprotein [Pseudomonadales bacterium]
MKPRIAIVAMTLTMAACTAVNVDPVADSSDLGTVCIVENPKVVVADFIAVVEGRFKHHGVATKLVQDRKGCNTTLDYTAERSWDLKPFLDYAQLTLRRDGVLIGSAEYRNRGGFTVTKYAGTASKMNPVVDELLGVEE